VGVGREENRKAFCFVGFFRYYVVGDTFVRGENRAANGFANCGEGSFQMTNVRQLKVNGDVHAMDVDAQASLLSVLREELDLTGTKYGCGEGQCGACTVLIDGVARRSCITPVGTVGEKQVMTIEGLAKGDRLHPVQEAFLEADAMQCAYCTSGMIMAAVSLLSRKADPSEAEVVDGMEGNICRCGTHPRIVAAIRKAAKTLQGVHP
jgi:nicotinate dehydrogenase subunit A